MQRTGNSVISIAGFDPCGGAGLLADSKVLEAHGVRGFGICTAITFQVEDAFTGVSWVPAHQIELQLDLLMNKYQPGIMKIGLIQNLHVLRELTANVTAKFPGVKIIWDPILSASAGFRFHTAVADDILYDILSRIYLITPNCAEVTALMKEDDALEAGVAMSRMCNVYLKSWINHASDHFDVLLEGMKPRYFKTESRSAAAKHGSGCVLSSSIAAHLAAGLPLAAACRSAKEYTREFLDSDKGLLGFHHIVNITEYA